MSAISRCPLSTSFLYSSTARSKSPTGSPSAPHNQVHFASTKTPTIHRTTRVAAVKESPWREYEDAVREKDLPRALRFLKSMSAADDAVQQNTGEAPSPVASYFQSLRLPPETDWQVLDTCLNADDMKLVGSAYAFLQARGLLPNYGKCKNIVLEGPRDVTPTYLREATGLEAIKFAPKKWGTSGGSKWALIAFLGSTSFLLSKGIEIRPNLAVLLAFASADAIFLGGSCLAQISSLWPPYRRRMLVHEAGHLLTAYLMGCPVRGVILDPIVAMQMGIKGQAGTQFWDENLESELAEGHLSGNSFDRYSMVLFAGIAAEALVYGDAEGGENDENLFRSISVLLRPPLSISQMSNQARWSLLQSYNLLKWHKKAHSAVVKALENGHSLSTVIRRIEEAIESGT